MNELCQPSMGSCPSLLSTTLWQGRCGRQPEFNWKPQQSCRTQRCLSVDRTGQSMDGTTRLSPSATESSDQKRCVSLLDRDVDILNVEVLSKLWLSFFILKGNKSHGFLTDRFPPIVDSLKSDGLWITSYDSSRAFAERFGCLQVRIIAKINYNNVCVFCSSEMKVSSALIIDFHIFSRVNYGILY